MLKGGFGCLVKHKDKLKDTDERLLRLIARHTNLTKDDIKTLDIENIEKRAGIKAKAKKNYFNWEDEEKDGWQNLKFVSESKLNKRELRMDKELVVEQS